MINWAMWTLGFVDGACFGVAVTLFMHGFGRNPR